MTSGTRRRRDPGDGPLVGSGLCRGRCRVTTYVAVGLVLRAGRRAGGRRRAGPPAAPADRRHARARRPRRRGRGGPRRARHPADLRRLDRTTCCCAQGFVHAQERFFEMDVRRHVTAGRLSELFGEDALETDMYVRTMGWRRVAERELRAARAGRPAPPWRRTPTASTPTSTDRVAVRDRARVHRARARRPRLPPGGLDAGRLARLAQGDGVGPARQHAGRDRPGADRRRGRQAARGRSSTRRTPTTSTPRSSTRARSSTASSSRTPRGGTRNPQRPPFGRQARGRRWPGPATASTGCPRWLGRGDGHRQQRLGGRRRALHDRRAAPGQRPAPRRLAARASGCRWACTAATSPTTARSTSRASPSPACPGVIIGHNADIAWGFTNLGPDVTDLYLERVDGDTVALRRRAPAAADPHRDDRGRPTATTSTITVRSTDHGPLLSDVADELADVGERRRSCRRPDRDERGTPCRWRGRPSSRAPTADAILALNRADRLGRVPGRGSPTSRRRRRTSCTPTARATSATRRPA